ncbi:hypothetical protein ACWDV4_24975 [Micromonospora sp. NPDC003197]
MPLLRREPDSVVPAGSLVVLGRLATDQCGRWAPRFWHYVASQPSTIVPVVVNAMLPADVTILSWLSRRT